MQPTEVIRENDEESVVSNTKKDENEADSDEELGRSEERINLDQVSVKSSKSTSSKQKAILSPEEVKKI